MTKEEKLFVKECDCPEIQKGWKPKYRDEVWCQFEARGWKGAIISPSILVARTHLRIVNEQGKISLYRKENLIFLPSLDQLITLMVGAKRYIGMSYNEKNKEQFTFIYNLPKFPRVAYVDGKTPEIAAVKAWKSILKEEK